jgi:magnesium transporter
MSVLPKIHVIPRILKPRKKPGLPPGSPVFTGEKKAEKVLIELFSYDENSVTEQRFDTITECLAAVQPTKLNWVNIDGLHDIGVAQLVGERFNLHPLVIEDIVRPDQRPKLEEYDDGATVFMVSRMVYEINNERIESEQLSLVLGKGFLLTFQERPGDVLDAVRNRLRSGKGRLRTRGCDYLAYALLDTVVDHYFILLERYGDAVERIEESIIQSPDNDDLRNIHHLKQGLITLRKSIWPMREVVAKIERGELKLFNKATLVYVRDLYDHCIRTIDSIESYRDVLSSLQDMYMSFISNRMNQIMKVLTVIATIFIPLTFIVGVYGMNFDNMPELHWKNGYFYVLGLLALVAATMILYFKTRRWL